MNILQTVESVTVTYITYYVGRLTEIFIQGVNAHLGKINCLCNLKEYLPL